MLNPQGLRSSISELIDRRLQGTFNNYRLAKETASVASVSAVVNDACTVDHNNSSSGQGTNPHVSQSSKWFPTAPAPNSAAASSSSIANALIHPHSFSQGAGPSHLLDPLINTSSALSMANRDQHSNNTGNVLSASRGFGDVSPSIPMDQVPVYILNTIYLLFSRHSTVGLPPSRDVVSTHRAHLAHLAGSHAIVYNVLKTFWLPYSPLFFRLVLPRTAPSAKPTHRSSTSHHKSSSSNSNHPTSHSSVNGDNQQANRTPVPGDQNLDSHRFFYWDPYFLTLSGPLTCPVCHEAPLNHCGPIRTGPLRVFDLPSSSSPSSGAHANAGLVPAAFYVIGMQYSCSQSTCARKFNSWDPRIVNNLPQVLADEWPVHFSQEAEQNDNKGTGLSGDAVSRPLYTLVRNLVQAGMPQQGIREILAQLWNWSDSEKEDHDQEEGIEDVEMAGRAKNDQEKAAEAVSCWCLAAGPNLTLPVYSYFPVRITGSGTLKQRRATMQSRLQIPPS